MVKSILLPVDIADDTGSLPVLEAAVPLARLFGARMHVVSVLPDFGMSQVGAFFPDGFETNALKAFSEALGAWVMAHVPEGIDAQPHVLHGTIYDEILRAADRLAVDLIVIGAQRPKLSDYLLGPNAARVVRHARQSVYVVRSGT